MRKSHERYPDFSIEWHEVPHILFPIRSLIENAGNPSHEPASISTIHPHHVHTRASRIPLYLNLSRRSHLSYQKTPLLSSANNPLPAFTLALQSTVPNTLPPSFLPIHPAPIHSASSSSKLFLQLSTYPLTQSNRDFQHVSMSK